MFYFAFFPFIPLFFLHPISTVELKIAPSTEIHEVNELAGKRDQEFSCFSPSSPEMAAQLPWLKNGEKLLLSSDDLIVSDRQTMDLVPRVQISEHSVLFRALNLDDSGVYDCVTPDQVILSQYRLTVRDVPEPPGTPRAELISSRNISLIWDSAVARNSPVSYYIILTEQQSTKYDGFSDFYSPLVPLDAGHGDRSDEDAAAHHRRRIITPDNGTTFTVTNLLPYTTYTFQLIAVSPVGHSQPSRLSPTLQTLPEAPSAAPVLILANSTGSSSIRLQWLPPSQSDWHGVLLGYRLFYRCICSEQTDEVLLDSPQAQTYEIRNLRPGRRYYISVQAFNDEGFSPAHTEAVSTLEAEPSEPRSLLIKGVTNCSVSLAWLPPLQFNGALLGYKIHHTHPAGFTDTKILSRYTPLPVHEDEDGGGGGSWVFYQLTDLQPYTTYHIRVTAFNSRGEGPYSQAAVNVVTDVAPPGSPQILNVTRVANNALLVEWTAPREIFRQLDYYYIQYSAASAKGDVLNTQQLLYLPTSPAKTRALEHDYTRFPVEQAVLTNLSSQHVYHIQVSAGTRSIVDAEKIFRGGPSLTFSVAMDPDSGTLDATRETLADNSVSVTEMVVIVAVVIIFGLFAVIFGLYCALRKRFILGTYTYLAPNSPKFDEKQPTFSRTPTQEPTCLSATSLAGHIKKLYADGQIGLSKEFESLQTVLQTGGDFPAGLKEAQRLENRAKNRYINVLAYDHSRVKLKHVWNCDAEHRADGDERDDFCCSPRSSASKTPVFDYINANFVDSFTSPAAYIVTQAPLPNTLVDFWSMVWDYKVRVIIMLTNLEENGRKKCELYWPTGEEAARRYGPYTVSLASESITAFYVVRNFTLALGNMPGGGGLVIGAEEEGKNEVRQVVQYLYSDWPDHGRPDVTVPLLRFIMKSSRAFEDESSGPPVVHCSAGVGRSGCYIALHSMLQQLDRTGHVDIFQYLLASRKQRMALCQNESQYALIYDALLEYIQSDQTEVYVATFAEYVDGLLKDNGRGIRQQHALIQTDTDTSGTTSPTGEAARETFNLPKNRSASFLPADAHRVTLTMRAGVPGSDYINAAYLPSYRGLRQFIVSQYPLEETVAAFWQMIWEYRIRNIIILNTHKISPLPELFYPGSAISDPQSYEAFQVTFDASEPDSGVFSTVTCNLSPLTDMEDKTAFPCQILHVSRDFNPGNTCQTVAEVYQRLESAGKAVCLDGGVFGGKPTFPDTVVLDECGGTTGALFCGLVTLRQQGVAEGSVDVYQTARLYSQARPGVFSSLEAYIQFYSSARAVCQQIAETAPLEQFCFAGSALHPSSPTHILNASKRLSAILEQEEHTA